MRCQAHLFVCLLITQSATLLSAQTRSPVMDYASVLNGLDVYHQSGRLQLEHNEPLVAAFLPAGSKVDVAIMKAGSTTPIHTQPMYTQKLFGAFSAIAAKGLHREFRFKQPGDYIAAYRANGKVMTRIPFKVTFKTNGDDFDPKTYAYIEGPWDKWSYLFLPLNDGPSGIPEFRMWARKISFEEGSNADKYDIQVKKDGNTIAVSSTCFTSAQEWQKMRYKLNHPESKGGRPLRTKELLANDGTYDVIVQKNKQLHAVYQFEVSNGNLKPHARQSSKHNPRTEYMIPRYAGPSISGDLQGKTFWTTKLSARNAEAVYQGKAAKVAGPTDADRAKWHWLPRSIDPNRPFKLTITNIPTRSDTMISAGEDMIVFGTGFPTGVQYMKAGDQYARQIPDGETYSSTVFRACGKKIVLVKKKQVYVFDTETEKLTAIPTNQISLYNVSGGLHRANLLHGDGYLVATVNDVAKVSDQTIVKVIDVSSEQPQIIPIKNADYTHRDVSCVDVDSKHGLLAVSSRQKASLYVANVARLANQRKFDLKDYRGISSYQIFLEKNSIVYADQDRKVRILSASDGIPKAITEEAFGNTGNGFVVRKGRIAQATAKKYGTRYHYAVSDLPQQPRVLAGTGTAIEKTSGSLGMAGCAAIAIDKTVFLAGSPSGGVGVGEHLQVLNNDDGTWHAIVDKDGTVVSAIDVTTSVGFLAFKAGGRAKKTTLGYATYGQRISIDSIPTATSKSKSIPPATSITSSNSTTTNKQNSGVKPTVSKENPHLSTDELVESMVSTVLENEQLIYKALQNSLSEKEARKRAVEASLTPLKQGDHAKLAVAEYKRRSSLIPADEKPKSTDMFATSNVDAKLVEAALAGQWRCIRFLAAGKELPDNDRAGLRLNLGGGQYALSMGANVEIGTYKVDANKAPHWITITPINGKTKGIDKLGAFKFLEDDQLMLVFTGSKERTSRFVSTKENNTVLIVYKKVK